jgi:hypothetical protein
MKCSQCAEHFVAYDIGPISYTRLVQIHRGWSCKSLDDDSAVPFDVADWRGRTVEPIVLGPGQSLHLQFGDVPFTEIPEVHKGDIRRSYLVCVKYQDALEPEVTRQTQLSLQLNGDTEGRISFGHLLTHNCADDDCL